VDPDPVPDPDPQHWLEELSSKAFTTFSPAEMDKNNYQPPTVQSTLQHVSQIVRKKQKTKVTMSF
jgi:hypothetical protein